MIDKLLAAATAGFSPRQITVGLRFTWGVILVIHIAFAWGLLAAFGLPGFAYAQDITRVQQSVVALADDVSLWRLQQRQSALEAEIRRLDQEIFIIEARMSDLQRAGSTPDPIYLQRVVTLRTDKAEADRRLTAFLQAHPELSKVAGS